MGLLRLVGTGWGWWQSLTYPPYLPYLPPEHFRFEPP